MVKAATIQQPFASLFVSGTKLYETRSWVTKYRGPVAIHAAAGMRSKKALLKDFPGIFEAAGMTYEEMQALPRGCVLATAELVNIWRICNDGHMLRPVNELDTDPWTDFVCPTVQETRLGFWKDGYFAWEFENVKPLATPIPAKGQLGLWNWEGKTIA